MVPNREQWPYDPYPLVVITRPARQASPSRWRRHPARRGVEGQDAGGKLESPILGREPDDP